MKRFLALSTVVLMGCLSTASFAQENVVSGRSGVVAADHPYASEVGARLLEDGGNATDAAVGTLLTLGVVNPFASGLGGGGFCLVRPADGDVDVLDFREIAPKAAHRDMFIKDGKADIGLTMRGGLAVGVPGEARGLEVLHKKYGKLKWSEVVRPARIAAEAGVKVNALLPKRLLRKKKALENSALGRSFQKKDGTWIAEGNIRKNPELGKLLKAIEVGGADAFYLGETGKLIVDAVQGSQGVLTQDDLNTYQPKWRKALRGEYRGVEVFAMPPPSSGGVTLIETLNILEGYDLHTLGQSTETTHLVVEALKHAYADRARWLGDADFVDVPVEMLTSKSYAARLRGRIRPWRTLETTAYGSAAPPPDDDGTSHVSVIDGAGNMAACTSTINTSFGSMVFVEPLGLILNNEMGDFTAQPGVPNNYGLMGTEQNSVQPGKRPLSSMSPTLVLKDGKPMLAVGASGGPTIITGTLLAILRLVDHRTSPEDAVGLPRIHHQWMPDMLFAEKLTPESVHTLEQRGHVIKERRAYNSVQLVLVQDDGVQVGVSDPRKHGVPAKANPKK